MKDVKFALHEARRGKAASSNLLRRLAALVASVR
jgi:hypothetical protein